MILLSKKIQGKKNRLDSNSQSANWIANFTKLNEFF
jgi:hypothetical protein